MRFLVKLGLFISAYLPLYLILSIKNWYNIYLIIFFVVLSLYSFVWITFFFIVKKQKYRNYVVMETEYKADRFLVYLIPYLLPFADFNINAWQDWLAMFFLFMMLFGIFSNSDLLYVNPTFLFFGYKFYNVKVYDPSKGEKKESEIVLISRRNNIKVDDKIKIKEIDDIVFLDKT